MKILNFFLEKNRWAILILIILVAVFWKIQQGRVSKFKNKYETEVKLTNALLDSIRYTVNQYGEVVSEKLTLQETIGNLEKKNEVLSKSQKELIKRVKEIDKENSIITAALIKSKVIIDSLLTEGFVVVNPNDSSINFNDSTEFLIYNITIGKAIPAKPMEKPTLLINNLSMPNDQFVEFHWKNKKKLGYPIEFSVSNSNKYFKTYDINSYAIPELQKEYVDPNGWQKIEQWLSKNGKIVGFVAGGVIIGAGGTYILMK